MIYGRSDVNMIMKISSKIAMGQSLNYVIITGLFARSVCDLNL